MDNILTHTRLKAKLVRTRRRLTRLAAFDAYFLPVALALVLFILMASGLLASMDEGAKAFIVYSLGLLIVVTLIRGIMRYDGPSREAVREALDATDPERPLSSLSDHPSKYNEQTRAYWQKHREHLHERAFELKAPKLEKEWRAKDPLFLRFVLPLLLIAVVALNYKSVPARFGDAVSADMGALFGADELQISAWFTPPEHTGEAPVYLTSDTGDLTVPAGSKLTFRVHGKGPLKLRRHVLEKGDKLQGRRNIRLKRSLDGAWQTELQVFTPQQIELRYWGARGAWTINTLPDNPPEVQFVNAPEPAEDEKFSFRWKAEDDYGLAEMALILTTTTESGVPPDQTDRILLDLPVAYAPLVEDTAKLNLVRHKWAGLPLKLSLEATDTGGQTAISEAMTYTLPEKLLLEPLAKSAQEIRVTVLREGEPYAEIVEAPPVNGVFQGLGDRLAAAPAGIKQAALMLDAVTYRPDIFAEDYSIYLGLKRAEESIRVAKTMDDLAPLDNLLWSVALRAEYGTLADAARRLEAARRALERALREGASEEEIRRLMQAFRDAAEDYIAARMADAIMNGPQGGSEGGEGDPPSVLGGTDLEDMLAALEDLTETGANDAARQLLDDVSNLLDNLEFQMGENGEGGMPFGEGEGGEEEEGTPEEQALQGALDRLSELMEEQRRLNDDTLQERYGSGDSDPNAPPSVFEDPESGNTFSEGSEEGENGRQGAGEGEEGEADQGTLADRQFEILEDLRAFSEELGEDEGAGSGITAEEFDRAQRALDRATNALRRGDLDAAQWNQDRAIQELRDAAGDLAGELDEQRAARRGETGEDTVSESDPLGRPAGGSQQNEGDGVTVPDEVERQRARDILDDLRERLNNAQTDEEREYLERLLDRFGGS